MTELEHAIKHIKTRADAWAVKEVTEALQSIAERMDKALSQEPTEKPMTVDEMEREYEKSKALFHKIVECDDAISREELLKAIDTWDKFGVDDTNSLFRLDNLSLPYYVPYIHYDDVIKCIKGMPSVTQSGKWITLENRFDLGDRVKCSECGQVFVVGDDVSRKYCPNCGTKMESEE